MADIFIRAATRLWRVIEARSNAVDGAFHRLRQPVTRPVSRFFIKLHINQSVVTFLRFLMVIAFLPLWIYEHYYLAVLLLALNVFLDILDGDLARVLQQDSEIRKFEDVSVDNLVVVLLALALIGGGFVSGLVGAYYIFIATLSWWFSVVRRNQERRSAWLFHAQASSLLFLLRFCVVTILMFVYAFFQVDIFSFTLIVLSVILTLSALYDYWKITRARTSS